MAVIMALSSVTGGMASTAVDRTTPAAAARTRATLAHGHPWDERTTRLDPS